MTPNPVRITYRIDVSNGSIDTSVDLQIVKDYYAGRVYDDGLTVDEASTLVRDILQAVSIVHSISDVVSPTEPPPEHPEARSH